jgi:cytochrome c oxidase subunit 2
VYFAIGVGGVTYALILWAVLHYRRRADRLPPQTRYHVPVEVAYTLIPVVIVLVLFGFTFRTSGEVTRLAEDPDVVIQVEGFQWQWSFWYPDLDVRIVGTPERPPTMVVPVGRTVRLVLTGNDVIHAFYVPDFLFKRDTIPGVRTQVDFVMPRPGTYRGVCAEYCGLNHDDMDFFVRGVPEAEFRAWAERQRVEAP